jgi:hypothetical protein
MKLEDAMQTRVTPRFLGVLALLALVALGHWLQTRVHLNHDVSYFVHFSRWLLQGRSLGDDLHDGNLPMVWSLFMPAAALVQQGFLDEAAAVRWLFSSYLLLSVALLFAVSSRFEGDDRVTAVGWIGGFVLVATLGPGFSFGQREHASVLFAMPYLATAALRLQGRGLSNRGLEIAVGVLAGIGFALKPHFIVIPALVELLLLIRNGWRGIWVRVESLALGATVALYAIGSFLLIGDYLEFTLGLTRVAYWAYGTAGFPLLLDRFLPVAQPFLYGVAIAALTRTWSWQHTVMLLAGFGYSMLYFVQMKGFVYQGYPVLVCAMTFLGIALCAGVPKVWARYTATRSSQNLLLAILAIVLALPPVKRLHDDAVSWYAIYNIAWGMTGQFRQAVIDVVDHFAPTSQSYFFAFTTHPFPAYPTASYVQAEYAGRSISQNFIPAYARIDEVSDPARREAILRAAQYQRRIVIEDFQRRPPSIVFAEATRARLGMNGRPFDDIAFYLEDPAFREIWRNYAEYQRIGPYRLFVRRGADPQRPLRNGLIAPAPLNADADMRPGR